MKDRTLLYYLDKNVTLTPTDQQVSDVYLEDWWIYLKPHFSDLIWQYYADRVVFVDRRFKLDASDTEIINNIIRAFAINLNTRNYEYKKLYETTQLEYNPIWNVDGVTGTIHETTYNDSTNETKSGSDTIHNTGNDDIQHRGYNTEDNNNSHHTNGTGNTRTVDTQKYVNTYDSIDHNPPAEYPSEHDHDSITDTINESGTDYTRNDYNSNDKTLYNSDHETEYGSAVDGSKDSYQKDLDLNIRQGNIGVTMTQQMIDAERRVALYDFYKKVVHDCVNTCTYAID